MKKTLLVSGVVLSVAAMTGCTDDTPEKVVPIEKGTEIKFGAHLESELRSRTYYGDEANDPTSTAWPIYWNGSDNPDHIFVYSPQALSTRNQADYTVNADTQEPSKATDLVKDGAFGVQTGPDETPYDFYAMYPSSAVKGQITAPSTVINATLSAEQSAVYAGTVEEASTIVPSTVTTGEVKYIMNPDMTNCLMTAATTGVDLATTQAVTLQFMPFASVLDILITGPIDNNTVTERDQCAVTSVTIEAPEGVYIAGDFSYDFSKTDMSEALTFGANASNNIVVSTLGTDADGNMTGVPLVNENTLRVKAFLLPNPALKNNDLTITVMTSDAQTWKKTIPASTMSTFEPKQIHRVKLPALKFAEADFDYSRWLSQLDPRIYLSEISLPGTTSSFSWKLLESDDETVKAKAMQSITVPEQFNAGARVFRCHVWLYGNITGVDGQTPGFGINVNGETYVRPLGEVIEQLYNIMETSHSDEFCVIMISDFKQTNLSNGVSGNSDPWNNDNGKTFYERFQKISQHWKDMGWVPDHIDANTTIGDVKGKIIVKLQLNGNGNITSATSDYLGGTDDSDGTLGTHVDATNNLLTKIDGWQAVNGCEALLNWWTAMNGRQIFYAPMAYGNVGTYSTTAFSQEPNDSGTRGTISVTTPGIGSDAASMVINSAQFVARPIRYDYWRYANCNVTTPPANFHDPNQLWYVYGAQASPSNQSQYDNAYDMITDIVNTIKTHYKTGGQTIHNKFFMTYLGGAGSYRTKDQITQAFVPQWNSLTTEANFGKNRPFGWVLFNEIQSADYKIPDGTPSTDPKALVTRGIQKVISRNNDLDFKLQRRKDPVTPAAAPSGDVKGTQSGGSIF